MANSVERYFRLLHGERKMRPGTRTWCPAADIYRTRDGWLVKVDLAGVTPDDLEITLSGATLRLSGCRRDTFYGEGVTCQQLEITYSRFEKTLQFPCPIEGAHLMRDYRDGLLILHLRGEENCEERTNDQQ
ncbi:MAG TPA: Hsp20/alpha crystallin family protein [Pyrinomonadaceae bacterium]|jgi:HSP20 family protein|nr:Hsp20/alpha crystallin family protein [Pyrinomonadaceae bacterium]